MRKHVRRALLYLYPRWWRKRYGTELLDLAEDTPAKWSDPLDIGKEAILMRLHGISRRPVWQVVVALTLTGAILGGVASKAMRTRYISTAMVVVDGPPDVISTTVRQSILNVASRRYLATLIQEHNLYPQQRAHAPLENIVEQFKRDIRITNTTGPNRPRDTAFSLAFVYEDGKTAQRVTSALVQKLIETNATLAKPAHGMRVVQQANVPLVPTSPVVWRVVAAGALAGLLLSLVVSVWTRRTREPRHHSA